MANVFTNAAATIPLADTRVSLYTATSVKGVIHSLFISNTTTSTVKVTVEVLIGATHYSLGTDIPIAPESTLVWDKPINLNDANELEVTCDTAASVTVFTSVLEIS